MWWMWWMRWIHQAQPAAPAPRTLLFAALVARRYCSSRCLSLRVSVSCFHNFRPVEYVSPSHRMPLTSRNSQGNASDGAAINICQTLPKVQDFVFHHHFAVRLFVPRADHLILVPGSDT